MKRLIIGAAAVICAAVFIAACSNNLKTAPSQAATPSAVPSASSARPSPTPKPSPSSSPEVTYTVKTDYSQLTPYEPMEEIYTRLSEDYMPELVPSDAYGTLVPYVGEVLYGYEEYLEYEEYGGISYPIGVYEGLTTLDGKIVTDPVFISIYSPSHYDVLTDSYISSPLYVLEKSAEVDTGDGIVAVSIYAICALDGSWVTSFDYEEIICCDQVMLLFRDGDINDFDAMDYSGNILYNSKNLQCFSQLQDYRLFYSDGASPIYDGEGYLAIWDWGKDARCVFFNEMSGDLITTEFSSATGFAEGLAAVEKDGLWGYIDTSFSLVISPVFEYVQDFHGGKAVVKLSDDCSAVIDTGGNVLYKSVNNIFRSKGYYQVVNHNNSFCEVFDSSLNKLFISAEVDTWERFGDGFSYTKDGLTTVLYENGEIKLTGIYKVFWVEDGYMFYGDEKTNEYSLTKLDGRPIAEFDKRYFSPIILHTPGDTDFFVLNDYVKDDFVIVNSKGTILTSGLGSAYVSDNLELISIENDQHFGYMDTSGKYAFWISLLDSIPD